MQIWWTPSKLDTFNVRPCLQLEPNSSSVKVKWTYSQYGISLGLAAILVYHLKNAEKLQSTATVHNPSTAGFGKAQNDTEAEVMSGWLMRPPPPSSSLLSFVFSKC